ncbi:hypothetical protein YC2023_119760 [Brassica napus]
MHSKENVEPNCNPNMINTQYNIRFQFSQLTSPIETTNVATRSLKDSVSRDLEREVDHLMRHEYPSPVNPKKRSPVHN